jgi:N-acetylmuramoyl-L-alanine amidase
MDTRIINKIVVHCSDSPDERDVRFEDINNWHKDRGFSGVMVNNVRVYCGYHYIICRDGTVEPGRSEHYIGAHVQGHNKNSIGICWVGRKKIADKQKEALMNMLRLLCLRYGLFSEDVVGHGELFKGKTCPNLDMKLLREQLKLMLPGGSVV